MKECVHCSRLFTQQKNLNRHVKACHENVASFVCETCQKQFNRHCNLIRHHKQCSQNQTGGGVKRKVDEEDKITEVKRVKPNNQLFKVEEVESALNKAFISYRINLPKEENDVIKLLHDAILYMEEKIHTIRDEKCSKGVKFFMSLKMTFYKAAHVDNITDPPIVFHSEPLEVYTATDVIESLRNIETQLLRDIEIFERNGSGWIMSNLIQLDTTILECDPLHASTYIPLPNKIQKKKAVLNIKNKDAKCFLWSVIAGIEKLHWSENANRVSQYYQFEDQYDVGGLSFPMTLKQISKFEDMNNIAVSVYGYEDENIYPLKVSKKTYENDRHIELLLFNQEETSHYTLIRNFNRLVRSQVTKHEHATHFCRFCLHGFTKAELLTKHLPYCMCHGEQLKVFPKDPVVQFKNRQKQLKAPFIVYADFECILKGESTTPSSSEPIEPVQKISNEDGITKQDRYQEHIPCSFAYKILSTDLTYQHELVLYVGEDSAEMFLARLQEDVEQIIDEYIVNPKPMNTLTHEEEIAFQNATMCHICDKTADENDRFVKDHCHITGVYRGPAHNSCNLNYKINITKYKIPVVIHNLRNYDSHLIIQGIRDQFDKINVIPSNMEKYISFSIDRLQFIDSYQFTNKSLSDLVDTLVIEDFQQLREEYENEEEFNLIKRKGVFPYDHLDSIQKFDESRLPLKDAFFNRLNNKAISEEDYMHADVVWRTFQCQTLRDYHDIYLKSDVLLLADVFEKFRSTCLNHYQLDPAHFFTAPGLAWQAALKITGVKLELLQDIDQHNFITAGIRGGISMISNRYAVANNPLVSCYDETKPTSYLMYYDANNLYGWAMSQFLPTGDFRWLSEKQIEKIDIMSVSKRSERGYILEVDIEYPSELHDEHNDYPLAPENITITPDMYSPLQKEKFPAASEEKLTPNLNNKMNYVIHYRNLQQYIDLGMRLTKIHRILEFKQSPWLKDYIDLNTQQRVLATSDFAKDFFKLMNNAVFGKTLENMSIRINIELITSEAILKKRVALPSFKRAKRFNNTLVGVHRRVVKLKLTSPIYIGFAILDISKIIMYDFHYHHMKQVYPGDKLKLLFTDTDSLAYEIKTDDVYSDMLNHSKKFDFSGYPKDHICYSLVNKKVLGKMKDEVNGFALHEFVGLRPKLYSFSPSFVDTDGKEKSKKVAKGVNHHITKQYLKHKYYKDSLFELSKYSASINMFKSDGHVIHSVNMKKIALSAFDTKRWLCDNGIKTLAHGHFATKQ